MKLTWIPWLGPACQVQLFTPPHNVLALGQRFDVVEPAVTQLQNVNN